MRWKKEDLELFFQSKEYIDTLCIPLIPLDLQTESEATKLANQNTSLQIISDELERNYTGRIMLSPPYTYIRSTNYEKESSILNQWTSMLSNNHFKHIFLLTYDVNWKKYERLLENNLIWLTATTIEDYQSNQSKKWVNEQVQQISELIRTYW
ncbi:DUF2487 family protein [Gracilibacillus salitolerans]|uniref:DUF2487 family protein n=1 Tax=Gracilibacillus salitolerans TaxID=2663022 RepID=A0A5Q2TIS4_9BACI|nr:DUF2487 family protein [Gracilibacillus salitolerans]QGH34784.1 DUF2487 family protein [Gracilibacillus salitolerans]